MPLARLIYMCCCLVSWDTMVSLHGLAELHGRCADASGCTLALASRQVRLHRVEHSAAYLRVASHPILEHCSGIACAPPLLLAACAHPLYAALVMFTDVRPSLSFSPHADCIHVLVMCTLCIGLLIEPMEPTPCGHSIAFAKELRTFWVCMHASAHEAWHWQGGALRVAVPGQRAAPGGRRPGRRERAVARRA